MQKDTILLEFIVTKFKYALFFNLDCEYSDNEYSIAKKLLKPDLRHFKKNEEELVIQAFACLFRSINNNLEILDKTKEADIKTNSESWQQHYDKTIELNRVIESFTYKTRLDMGKILGKTFPIEKVIFQGSLDEDKIVIEGTSLELIRQLFISLHGMKTQEEKQGMNDFSHNLYNTFEEYRFHFNCLLAAEDTIASQAIKISTSKDKKKVIKIFKYSIAFNLHSSLKGLLNIKSTAKYPSIHKKIIGKILNEFKLFEFKEGYSAAFDKDMENFITRGDPKKPKKAENTTKTKKPKK